MLLLLKIIIATACMRATKTPGAPAPVPAAAGARHNDPRGFALAQGARQLARMRIKKRIQSGSM
jgi:hypothetical protein